jgi:hypothetical protein
MFLPPRADRADFRCHQPSVSQANLGLRSAVFLNGLLLSGLPAQSLKREVPATFGPLSHLPEIGRHSSDFGVHPLTCMVSP